MLGLSFAPTPADAEEKKGPTDSIPHGRRGWVSRELLPSVGSAATLNYSVWLRIPGLGLLLHVPWSPCAGLAKHLHHLCSRSLLSF